MRRAIHEAQLASKLHHTNVATIYDAVGNADGHFICMEYVYGVSLRKLLQREGTLAAARISDLAIQILTALDNAMAEITSAAHAIRILAETINNQPESLLKGRR